MKWNYCDDCWTTPSIRASAARVLPGDNLIWTNAFVSSSWTFRSNRRTTMMLSRLLSEKPMSINSSPFFRSLFRSMKNKYLKNAITTEKVYSRRKKISQVTSKVTIKSICCAEPALADKKKMLVVHLPFLPHKEKANVNIQPTYFHTNEIHDIKARNIVMLFNVLHVIVRTRG